MPIIIDCDPGIDDAIALAMAVASPELEVLGVTTTYGNVGLDNTTRNALRVLDWLGSPIPVYRGVDRSLLGPAVDAAAYHGANGMEAPRLGESHRGAEEQGGVAFLIETLLTRDGSVTLVALGPLTNLAIAIRLEPRIIGKIERIVLMGGSTDYGNDSPAAEFNMLCDPHAAQIMFSSGIPIVMFGLNLTHQVIAPPDEIQRIRSIGNESSAVFADMITFFEPIYIERFGFAGAAIHDPYTIAYLLKPELFQLRSMRVDVETGSSLSFGRTVHDIWGLGGQPKNAQVAMSVNVDDFFELLRARLSELR